ncbi:MAG: stage III sporulation protein AE [Lachnospiraceae bacterium]|nr:stage III sporulation protein AE [Lachnospiraceae bacterium]
MTDWAYAADEEWLLAEPKGSRGKRMTETQLYETVEQWFSGFQIDTEALIAALWEGDFFEAFQLLGTAALGLLGNPVTLVRSVLFSFLLLGIGGAVLKILDETMRDGHVKLIGGWIIRLMTAAQLLTLFYEAMSMCRELLNTIVTFGNFFVPVFSVTLATVSGTGTSAGYIALLSLIIYITERVLLKLLLPLVEVHFLLVIMAGFWQKERLERILKLLEKVLSLVCKGILGAVTGMGFLQSLLLPYADALKIGAVQKAAEMIPGVGAISGTAWDFITGSAVLLKNTIGVLGVLALALTAAWPLFRLLVLQLALKLSAALMGLMGAGELCFSVDQGGVSVEYLLKLAGLAVVLFLVWVVLAVCTTNQRMMF